MKKETKDLLILSLLLTGSAFSFFGLLWMIVGFYGIGIALVGISILEFIVFVALIYDIDKLFSKNFHTHKWRYISTDYIDEDGRRYADQICEICKKTRKKYFK